MQEETEAPQSYRIVNLYSNLLSASSPSKVSFETELPEETTSNTSNKGVFYKKAQIAAHTLDILQVILNSIEAIQDNPHLRNFFGANNLKEIYWALTTGLLLLKHIKTPIEKPRGQQP